MASPAGKKDKRGQQREEEPDKDKEKAPKGAKKRKDGQAPTKAVYNKRVALWRKQSVANIQWYCDLCEVPFDPDNIEQAIHDLASYKDIEVQGDAIVPSASTGCSVSPAKRMTNKEEEKLAGNARWSCCSKWWGESDIFCETCGKRAPSADAFCMKCGRERSEGANFCGKCGTKFPGGASTGSSAQADEGKDSVLSALQKLVAEADENPGTASTQKDKATQVKTWNLVDMTAFILASGDAKFRYWAQQSKTNRRLIITRISSVEQFTAAWAVVIRTATEHAPNHVPELTDHLLRIGALARKHELNWQSVAEYDVSVRTKKAENPKAVSLGEFDSDAWCLAYDKPGSVAGAQPKKILSQNGAKEVCRSFNYSEKCKFADRCNYAHTCLRCGSTEHGKIKCPSNVTGQDAASSSTKPSVPKT